MKIIINGQERLLDEVEPDTPLLWVLRDELKLTGTKFGCGMALCGACTVHVNGNPIRSCSTPISAVEGQSVTTIEGLGTPRSEEHTSELQSRENLVCRLLLEKKE